MFNPRHFQKGLFFPRSTDNNFISVSSKKCTYYKELDCELAFVVYKPESEDGVDRLCDVIDKSGKSVIERSDELGDTFSRLLQYCTWEDFHAYEGGYLMWLKVTDEIIHLFESIGYYFTEDHEASRYETYVYFNSEFIPISTRFGDNGIIPITNGGPFKEGKAPIKETHRGLWGYVNCHFEYIIEPKFQWATPFRSGLAKVKIDNRWGFIDHSGNNCIQPIYNDAFSYQFGYAPVCQYSHHANEKLEEITKHMYKSGWNFSDERRLIRQACLLILNSKWHVIDYRGTSYLESKYECIAPPLLADSISIIHGYRIKSCLSDDIPDSINISGLVVFPFRRSTRECLFLGFVTIKGEEILTYEIDKPDSLFDCDDEYLRDSNLVSQFIMVLPHHFVYLDQFSETHTDLHGLFGYKRSVEEFESDLISDSRSYSDESNSYNEELDSWGDDWYWNID
jgi:hypothetical protein